MKKSFISLLKKAVFVPPVLVILVSAGGWAFHEYMILKNDFSEEASRLIEERRNYIKERASVADSYIAFQRESVKSRKKAGMLSKVSDAFSLVNSFHKFYGVYDKKMEDTVVKSLENMEFGESGGFIFRENGEIIFSDKKPGNCIFSSSDSIPAMFLSSEIKKSADAPDQIHFVKTKNENGISRLFCLKKISSSGWIIGMSTSLDDIEKEAMDTVSGWFSRLESIGRNGFIFIADRKGMILSHTGISETAGKNIASVTSESLTHDEILQLSEKKNGYYEIKWAADNLSMKRNSIVTSFPVHDWGWTIGVGFFTDDMDRISEDKKNQGIQKFVITLRFIGIALTVLVIAGAVISKRIVAGFENNFLGFHNFFTDAKKTGNRIKSTEMSFSEFESMAEAANSMLEARQLTEDRLRQSESNFASFFNSIGDGIFVVDENLAVLSMNPSATTIIGIQPQTRDFNYISEYFDSGITAGIKNFINRHDLTINEKTKQLGQGYILKGTRSEKIIEAFIFEGMWNSYRAFFILVRDISLIVASEEKFSRIFSESSVMMSVSTIDDGRFIDINRAAIEQLEYPREYFIGKTSAETGIFADPSWRDKIGPIIKRYGRLRDEEAEFITGTGKRIYFLLSIDIISYSGSRYLLTVANNITERKKAEQALMRAKENALRSKAQLEDTLRELELFNRLMMDREERIIALKAEVNGLRKEKGEPSLYTIEEQYHA